MSHTTVDYVRLIHERGFRVTPQRQLILDAVCAGRGHTTPEEIFERVRSTAPTLNRATIYRNLDFLCEMHLIVATQIGGKRLYEIAGKNPHHHLVCRQCGAVEALPAATVQAMFHKVERDQGFAVEMDHLTLIGLCSGCAQAAGSRQRRRSKPGGARQGS